MEKQPGVLVYGGIVDPKLRCEPANDIKVFQVESEASGHAMYGKAREEDMDLEEAARDFFLQGKEV